MLTISEDLTHTGQSKTERYKWKMLDKPGTFRLISKDRLEFNRDDYQRDALEPKVLELAANWSWFACGVILVAHRAGRFYVFDGQYRTLARYALASPAASPSTRSGARSGQWSRAPSASPNDTRLTYLQFEHMRDNSRCVVVIHGHEGHRSLQP